MTAESEFNIRHFHLMNELLAQFENKYVSTLGKLVRRLDEINGILEIPGAQWDSLFDALWMDLELVYADALEEDRDNLSDAEMCVVDDTVGKISKLVSSKIVASN